MFHKAVSLEYLQGTTFELTFQDGKVKQYDMAILFDKYPQLKALENRDLFLSGRLISPYGIVWNDDLDIETETIYEEGLTVRIEKPAANVMVGEAVAAARTRKGISQKELSEATGIDQSGLSKCVGFMTNQLVR